MTKAGLKARDAGGRGLGYQQRGRCCWEGRGRFCRNLLGSRFDSRDLSGRGVVVGFEPRESAFGLIPGLDSPGPLGRPLR